MSVDAPTAPVPRVAAAGAPAPTPPRHQRARLVGSAALAVPAIALSALPALQFTYWQWIALTLAAPVVTWGAWPFHRAAVTSLRRGAATADTLVSLGVLAALGWSLHALLLGTAGVPGTTRAYSLTPAPGAATYLEVAAGVTALTLAGRQLDAMVAADGRRSADRLAAAFTPAAVALAVATLGYWLGSGSTPTHAVGAAAAVLIVACPCALAAARPLALVLGTRRAARLGVAVAGPKAFDSARRVDTVALATVGTVTTGERKLLAVHPADWVTEGEALRLAAAAVAPSQHPVARAVVAAARDRFGELPGVAEFDEQAGLGARGIVAEVLAGSVVAHAVLVGRPELLTEHDIALPAGLAAARADAGAAGHHAVAVAWDGIARAVLVVADPVRPTSAEAVRGLRGLGLTPVLLAGGEVAVARAVAEQVGVEPVIAGALPGDGAAAVRRLQAEGRVVALVGDGVADAVALAAAELGVALGTAGSGLIQVRGDLRTAVSAIRLARRTADAAKGNLVWAFACTLPALPLAAAGLLTPMVAGIAAAGSAVLVAANSLRLCFVGRAVAVDAATDG